MSDPGNDKTLVSDATDETMAATAAMPGAYEHLLTVEPAHYSDRATLTSGGMGRIVTAFDRRLQRTVAIKELRTQAPDFQARFQREVLLTAKLDHPNIVSVHEAGRWPSGEPFYSMRLVAGRPFDRVIDDAKTLADRLALLPHVIAVADALAYAHQQRVIHRDLKPQNVMIGEFGETVVIDWGLGKSLGEPDAVDVLATTALPGGDAETTAGAVMGTPGYMPPEQAEGHPADERSDVYAIGAMLYHLLAGGPPYTGKSSGEIIEAVRSGAPPPLQERERAAPADLLAVVTRAMARAPEDRYATAKGLAADLRRFQAGQLVGAHRYSLRELLRRWLRRHRAPVGVGLVALAVLVVVGIVSLRKVIASEHEALHQRAIAEHHRADAEELMDFMLFDLSKKLAPIGKIALLDAVATKAADYYERATDLRSDDEQHRRLAALDNLADVLLAEARTGEAVTVSGQAVEMAQARVDRRPSASAWRDLAVAHHKAADALLAQGEAGRALEEARASLVAAERLAATAATLPPETSAMLEPERVIARSHDEMAEVLQSGGDLGAALDEYRAALAIREALAAGAGTTAEIERDVSVSHNQIGSVLQARGDPSGALAEFRAALAIRERLAAASPDDFDAQRDVSSCLDRIGYVLIAQGDAAAALQAFRADLAIAERLALHDPANATWQRDLAVSHNNVGDVLHQQGDAAGALAEYRAALAIETTLADRDASNTDRQRDLLVGHEKVGFALQLQGDVDAALAEHREQLAIAERLVRTTATNADWQRDLAVAHQIVGNLLLKQGHAAKGLVEYRAALSSLQELANDPTNHEAQRDLAIGHDTLGDALLASKDAKGAIEEYRTAQAILERLVATDPDNAEWAHDVELGNNRLGDALLPSEPAKALEHYRAAAAIAEKLVVRDASSMYWLSDLAVCHQNVALGLIATGDRAGGLASFQEALAIAKRLQAKEPSNPTWPAWVAEFEARVQR